MGIVKVAHYSNGMKGVVAWKSVECELCQSEYIYKIERWTGLEGPDLAKLQRTVEKESQAVPCPSCGQIQKHMIPAFRAAYCKWMIYAGIVLLIVFGIVNIVAFVVSGNTVSTLSRFLYVVAAAIGVTGLVLIVGKHLLAVLRDPNSNDAEKRKRRVESQGFPAKDFETIVHAQIEEIEKTIKKS